MIQPSLQFSYYFLPVTVLLVHIILDINRALPAKKSCYCVITESKDYFQIYSYSNEPHLAFLKLFFFQQRPLIVKYAEHIILKIFKFDLATNLLMVKISIWQRAKYSPQMHIEIPCRWLQDMNHCPAASNSETQRQFTVHDFLLSS